MHQLQDVESTAKFYSAAWAMKDHRAIIPVTTIHTVLTHSESPWTIIGHIVPLQYLIYDHKQPYKEHKALVLGLSDTWYILHMHTIIVCVQGMYSWWISPLVAIYMYLCCIFVVQRRRNMLNIGRARSEARRQGHANAGHSAIVASPAPAESKLYIKRGTMV